MPVTERMKAAARYMREHFEYKPDGLFETWRIGRMRGDCEDFALTTLWLLCGEDKDATRRTLLDGDARIIRTKTHQGNYHAVLQYNGKFICNRYPTWSDWRSEYEMFKPYKGLVLRLKLLLS